MVWCDVCGREAMEEQKQQIEHVMHLQGSLAEGVRVEVAAENEEGEEMLYPATIITENDDGTYEVPFVSCHMSSCHVLSCHTNLNYT